MELPDLEGQPGWVVIVVVALFVAGSLGVAYLRFKSKHDPEDAPQIEAEDATVALPAATSAAPLDLVRDSMGVLATQAAQNKQDADRAEDEAKELATRLAECQRQMAVIQVRHEYLEAQLRDLIRRNGERP